MILPTLSEGVAPSAIHSTAGWRAFRSGQPPRYRTFEAVRLLAVLRKNERVPRSFTQLMMHAGLWRVTYLLRRRT